MTTKIQINTLSKLFDSPSHFHNHQNQANYIIQKSPLFLANSNQITQQLQEDIQNCSKLLKELNYNTQQLFSKILVTYKSVSSEQMIFDEGIGYFDTKNILFLQYLTELNFYILFKLNGIDLSKDKGLQLYKNLIYLKTLLMKLQPLQKKLQYKVNKILKEGANKIHIQNQNIQNNNNNIQQEDSLKYKPNPQNLVKERTHQNINKKTQKYVVPKISSTLMKQDKIKQKEQLKLQRKKKFLMRKLRGNFVQDDQIAEDINMKSEYEKRMQKQIEERTRYQQQNFLRLPLTKKDKFIKKKIQKEVERDDVGDLDELKKIRQLLHYQKLIEADYQKEQKLNKTLGISKKIKKPKLK